MISGPRQPEIYCESGVHLSYGSPKAPTDASGDPVAIADSFGWWAVAAVLLGLGTAMVYPTLLAAIGDVAHPLWRARAVGTYRLWRDSGFAVGALLAGVLADLFGIRVAVGAVAALTALSGLVVALRMYETHHGRGR